MMNLKDSEVFEKLAEKIAEDTMSRGIPGELPYKFIIFLEVTRTLDYWTVFRSSLTEDLAHTSHQYSLLVWGWNKAASSLFKARESPGIPFAESNPEYKDHARGLLHNFGLSSLFKKTAEMIKSGLLLSNENNGTYTLKAADSLSSQFLDNIEFSLLEKQERAWENNQSGRDGDWILFDKDDQEFFRNKIGSYTGINKKNYLKDHIREDIDSLMIPLIKPWDSGYGTFIGYEAIPEVDDHYFAKALELIEKWRFEAGFHPNTEIAGVSGAEISVVVGFMIAMHLKHIDFCLLALKHYKEISIYESLTIWEDRKGLEQAIAIFTEFDVSVISKCIDAISLKETDMAEIGALNTPVIPLIIDLGNEYILRPVSSIYRNPFLSVITLNERRSVEAKNIISEPREGMMRMNLYSVFQGSRYKCIPGNIKIKDKNVLITDIDAAIFDLTTGELAIFQLKWQNFYSSDPKELRSRASNFIKELDSWTQKIEEWILRVGWEGVKNTLRLNTGKIPITRIYLFGIGQTSARMQGYGYKTQSEQLAVANWPHFIRVRHEIGPTKYVFKDLHGKIYTDMNGSIKTTPIPVTFKLGEITIHYEDMWKKFDEEDD